MTITEIGVCVTIILSAGGVIFAVYNRIRNPQVRLDKRQTTFDKEQAVHDKAEEGRALVLAQQLQWEKENNNQRFQEITKTMNSCNELAYNHVHTIDVKVENLTKVVSEMGGSIIKLTTIIDERIPKKQ